MDVPEFVNRIILTLPVLVGCGLCLLILRLHLRRKIGFPLPPGPPGLPLLQNLFDIPTERPWITAIEWARKYGDLIHLGALGQHLIFVASYETAVDLMEKRSALYSDRTHSTMLKLMDGGNAPGLMKYGDDWRFTRRVFHQELNSSMVARYLAPQRNYALEVLSFVQHDADSFVKHFEHFASGVILETIYGFKIQPADDPYVKMSNEGAQGFLKGLIPGAFLVDILPLLKWIPLWFPGAKFKRDALRWGEAWKSSCRLPFEEVAKGVNEGTAVPSFTASWLSRLDSSPGQYGEKGRALNLVSVAAAAAHLAGHESTLSTMLNFVLHMIQHPEIQGGIAYLGAIYKETLRLHPVTPLGVPHGSSADGIYKGMHIPKGSILLPNIWAMSRDEKEYGPDSETFRPERFLDSNVRDPDLYVFGFGRRICPGRYLAANSVFILTSYLLQVFSIGRALDDDGTEKPLDPQWIEDFAMRLKPFPASFKPRFEGAERLIQVD